MTFRLHYNGVYVDIHEATSEQEARDRHKGLVTFYDKASKTFVCIPIPSGCPIEVIEQ